MIKRKYRRTRINTLSQLAEMVNSSTLDQRNTAYMIGHDASKPFTYYGWSEYLQQSFTIIPQITKYHHFRFSERFPGSVFVKQFADSSETEIKIAKVGRTCGLSENTLPTTLTPAGLSNERQVYLYEQIRPFCDAEYRDIVCPLPERYSTSVQEQDKDTAPPRSKRLCSHCRNPGHTKTKSGKITCPELLKEL